MKILIGVLGGSFVTFLLFFFLSKNDNPTGTYILSPDSEFILNTKTGVVFKWKGDETGRNYRWQYENDCGQDEEYYND